MKSALYAALAGQDPKATSSPSSHSSDAPNQRRAGASLWTVRILLAGVVSGGLVSFGLRPALAWDTTYDDGRRTHEIMSLRAAQTGGYPNAGHYYDLISSESAEPDHYDVGWVRTVRHTSIAWSHAVWTEMNLSLASLSRKWAWSELEVFGFKFKVYYLAPDLQQRARFIGRGIHYLEDEGQPYHDFVVQSTVPVYVPCWDNLHDAFEGWAHANGDFRMVDSAEIWPSPNPYVSAAMLSVALDPFYFQLLLPVDRSYLPCTKTLTPSSPDATTMRLLVDLCWLSTATFVKGVYRYNTATALSPETIDLYVDSLNDPVNGYAPTKAPGHQARLDLARI